MRKMALDVGTVRIGIATSDPMGIIASGYETYTRTGNVERDMKYITQLAESKGCDTFVIGLPLNMDGTEGEKVLEIRAFAEELSKYSPLKIAFQDERWSTVSAEKMLIQKVHAVSPEHERIPPCPHFSRSPVVSIFYNFTMPGRKTSTSRCHILRCRAIR
mgnify:CR=1 FL=1